MMKTCECHVEASDESRTPTVVCGKRATYLVQAYGKEFHACDGCTEEVQRRCDDACEVHPLVFMR